MKTNTCLPYTSSSNARYKIDIQVETLVNEEYILQLLFLTREGAWYFVAHYYFPGCISKNPEYPGPKIDDIDFAMNVSPEWNKAIPLLIANDSFCFVLRGIFLRNNVFFG